MGSLRKKVLAKGTRILDLAVMIASLITAGQLYPPIFWPAAVSTPLQQPGFTAAILLLLVTWNHLFKRFGLYQVRRLDEQLKEWLDITAAVTVGTLLFAAAAGLITAGLSLPFISAFFIIALTATLIERTIVRAGLIFLRQRGRNLRYIVFVGSGPQSVDLAQRVLQRRELGYRLLGFVDDSPARARLWQGKWLCTFAAFPEYLLTHEIDEIFLVLPIKAHYELISHITLLCGMKGIPCRVPADWMDLKTASKSSFELNGVPMVTVHNSLLGRSGHLLCKRMIDILLAGLGMIVLAPLFLLVTLLIALTSPGPIFFTQQRVGYNRRRFNIYKFRTMIDGAEALQPMLEHLNEADGAAFKITADPRVTTVGRWLRKTSVDEIPQLFNVLKGDMSLVGPRPLPIRDVNRIRELWPIRRFSMRPGLTCLWQINGRSHRHFNEWMRLDLQYIDEWSIWLDFKIMLRTIPELIRASGQ